MDGSGFRHLGAAWDLLFSWPILVIFGVGVLSIIGGLLFGAWWLLSHLQWVW